VKVAIVGAGPAGISAALSLARMGFSPEIFEAKDHAGGMVGGAVPRYRLDDRALSVDLERLESLGVTIHLGTAIGRDVTIEDLRSRFSHVFLGVGAQKGKRLGIPGEEAHGVIDALEFLDRLRSGVPMDLGKRVLVVGGGNSAMDGARSAQRLVSDGEVSLVYRRTRAEMPADPEEVHDCLVEGIGLKDLLAPSRVVIENGRAVGLACTRMKLGPPDASGRPRPVPVDGSEVVLPADTIITAIGQETVLGFLDGANVDVRRDGTLAPRPGTDLFAGGDVVRGPASIIKAVADGRAAAEEIAKRHGVTIAAEPHLEKAKPLAAMMAKKARLEAPQAVPSLPVEKRGGFTEVLQSMSAEAARAEAARCLDCDEVCSLCVTVCPNRANLAYVVAPLSLEFPSFVVEGGEAVPRGTTTLHVEQHVQIVNLADACNECGNCTTFCPTSGSPFRDKPRFWLDREGFEKARSDAYRMTRENGSVVIEAKIAGHSHRLERGPAIATYRSGVLSATLDPTSWKLVATKVEGAPVEGEAVDLGTCAHLIALLHAEPALPPL
jgi:putative selenate reductase